MAQRNTLRLDIELDDNGSITKLDNLGSKIEGLATKGTFKGTFLGNLASGAVTKGIDLAADGVGALFNQLKLGTEDSMALNAAISDIAAVANKSTAEVEPLKDLIFQLGLDPKLKVDLDGASSAIEMLVRNGVELDDVFNGAARSTILLANATGGEFGNAADIVTDVMDLFNIEAEGMQDAVNLISGVVSNTKFDLNDFALAVGQGGAQAVLSGVSFDEFASTIATIASAFPSGSRAGVAFRQMLQGLTPRTQKQKELMEELNLTTEDGSSVFFKASGEFRSMSEVAEILNKTFANMTEEERQVATELLFMQESLGAVNNLTIAGAEGFNTFADAIGAIDAEEAAAKRMDNLQGSLEILGDQVSTLRTKFADEFEPELKKLVDALIPIVDEHGEKFVELLIDIGEEVLKMLPTITEWVLALGELPEKWAGWNEAVETATDGLFGLNDILQTVWQLISDPFIAAWDGVKFAIELVKGVLEELKLAFDVIMFVVQSVIDAWNTDFLALQTIVTTFWEFLQGVWKGIKEGFNSIVEASSTMATGMTSAWESIKTAAQGLWDFLVTVWDGIVASFNTVVEAAQGFGESLSQAWESVKQAAQALWDSIKEVFNNIKETIQTAIDNIKEQIGSLAEKFDEIKTKIAEIIDGIKEKFNEMLTTIKEKIDAAKQAFQGLVDKVGEIKQGIEEKINEIIELIKSIPQRIRDAFANINLRDVGANLIQGLIGGVDSKLGELRSKAQEAANIATEALATEIQVASPSKLTFGFGQNFAEGFILGIDSLTHKLSNLISSIGNESVNSMNLQPVPISAGNTISNTITIPVNITVDDSRNLDAIRNSTVSGIKEALRIAGIT